MANVSFQVIDGVDKGRTFVNLETPVTIGREEGNAVRLNDDRVSRFHAKVQEDQGHVVLTDLDSTNGTRINGETVQLRLLRPGDRVNLGRSTLVFGTIQEIASNMRSQVSEQRTDMAASQGSADSFVGMGTDISASEVDFDMSGAEPSPFERVPQSFRPGFPPRRPPNSQRSSTSCIKHWRKRPIPSIFLPRPRKHDYPCRTGNRSSSC